MSRLRCPICGIAEGSKGKTMRSKERVQGFIDQDVQHAKSGWRAHQLRMIITEAEADMLKRCVKMVNAYADEDARLGFTDGSARKLAITMHETLAESEVEEHRTKEPDTTLVVSIPIDSTDPRGVLINPPYEPDYQEPPAESDEPQKQKPRHCGIIMNMATQEPVRYCGKRAYGMTTKGLWACPDHGGMAKSEEPQSGENRHVCMDAGVGCGVSGCPQCAPQSREAE